MTLPGTIPSRALEIWRRLYTRFALEPGPASIVPDVSKTIVPVTQVDPALMLPNGETKTLDLSGAAGGYVVMKVVPSGKRYWLTSFGHVGVAAGTSLKVSVNGAQMNLTPTGTGSTFVKSRIALNPGDSLGAQATGNGGDTSRRFDATWDEEDV